MKPKAVVRKVDVDRDVALETGIGREKVRLITQVFLHKVMRSLIEGQEVTLDSFGRFRMAVQGGAPPPHARFGTGDKNEEGAGVRLRVHFKKSLPFTRAVKKHLKEKPHGEVRRRRISG